MVRGRFMRSGEDCAQIFALREQVFVDELGFSPSGIRDEYDLLSYYALVSDETDMPSGTGRLTLIDDRFVLGKLCVRKEARGQGLGDLLMRMLLVRAQELNAPHVWIRARTETIDFYRRYGFLPTDEREDVEGRPHWWMTASAEDISLEGKCRKPGGDFARSGTGDAPER